MRILALDVETMYVTAGVWAIWQQNIGLSQIFDTGGMICYAAKYVGESTMHFRRKGDKDFLTHLHKLINDADSLLSYNGKKFDIKKINKEFLLAGMKPPAPCKHIDLLQTVKARFSFVSNKLQHVSEQLGIGSKTAHEGFPLWIKCAEGDEKAWKKMRTYNIQDVRLLEKLYYKLIGWIQNHPSHALDNEISSCPNCNSSKLQHRGYAATKVAKYARLQCQGCGAWSREKVNEVHPDNRSDIVVSL